MSGICPSITEGGRDGGREITTRGRRMSTQAAGALWARGASCVCPFNKAQDGKQDRVWVGEGRGRLGRGMADQSQFELLRGVTCKEAFRGSPSGGGGVGRGWKCVQRGLGDRLKTAAAPVNF